MSVTSIQWTDRTWNPTRGCSRISEGCRSCYAEVQAARFSGPGHYAHGFVKRTENGPRWTGKVALVGHKLREPLSWRKPQRVFVNSMSDLFHESLPDDAIDRVFAVMALAPQHTFQVLTKRAARMRAYMTARETPLRILARKLAMTVDAAIVGERVSVPWPTGNVWLGVSVEDQAHADERIPLLLDTPAAVRFVSAEPLLGPVDLVRYGTLPPCIVNTRTRSAQSVGVQVKLDWIIVGGESGPGARPCDVAWIRGIVEQCKAARVPIFCKQLGANAVEHVAPSGAPDDGGDIRPLRLSDRKGGDPSEWPEQLRVREFPREVHA